MGNINTESEWSKEGTEAHKVAEMMLLGWTPPTSTDPDMVRHAKSYVAGIENYKDMIDATWVQAETKYISKRYEDVGGTIDALMASFRSRVLVIVDFKYGEGITVSPVENDQELFYTGLALESLSEQFPEIDFSNWSVYLVIHQPRGIDAGWRQWVTTGKYVHDDLRRRYSYVEDIKQGKIDLVPGRHCRWCDAKAVCPAFYKEFLAPLIEAKPVPQLPQIEIYNLYKNKDLISNYLKVIEEYIKSRCAAFGSFESFMLGQGKGQTSWLNPVQVEAKYPQDKYPSFYKTSLKTPKQIIDLHKELKEEFQGQYKQVTYPKLVSNTEKPEHYIDLSD